MRHAYLQLFLLNIICSSASLLADTDKAPTTQQLPDKSTDKKDDAKPSGTAEAKPHDQPAAKKEAEPPKIGNFSLPTSQQPAALVGFGGNIIDQGEVQIYFFGDAFFGKKKNTVDLIPSVLFGITKDWSIFFNFPVTPLMRDGKNFSRGFEDFFLQLEYAFYNKSTKVYSDQATVVANITVPTGSVTKTPPTGFGAPSIFIGGTYYHMLVDWFVFGAPGAVLTFSDNRTKIGDQFLYQFGVGRNFPSPRGTIWAWMLELDGQYNKRNRVDGSIDPNSGGNFIYATPSLWFSTKEWLLQLGVGVPITQHLFGKQRKFDYVFNLNFAWSFY